MNADVLMLKVMSESATVRQSGANNSTKSKGNEFLSVLRGITSQFKRETAESSVVTETRTVNSENGTEKPLTEGIPAQFISVNEYGEVTIDIMSMLAAFNMPVMPQFAQDLNIVLDENFPVNISAVLTNLKEVIPEIFNKNAAAADGQILPDDRIMTVSEMLGANEAADVQVSADIGITVSKTDGITETINKIIDEFVKSDVFQTAITTAMTSVMENGSARMSDAASVLQTAESLNKTLAGIIDGHIIPADVGNAVRTDISAVNMADSTRTAAMLRNNLVKVAGNNEIYAVNLKPAEEVSAEQDVKQNIIDVVNSMRGAGYAGTEKILTSQINADGEPEILPVDGTETAYQVSTVNLPPETSAAVETKETVLPQIYTDYNEAVQKITEMVIDGRRTGENFHVRMLLNPATLGEVAVRVVYDKGNVSINMVTDNSFAQKELLSQSSELRTTLAEHNLNLMNFDIGNRNPDGRDNSSGSGQRRNSRFKNFNVQSLQSVNSDNQDNEVSIEQIKRAYQSKTLYMSI